MMSEITMLQIMINISRICGSHANAPFLIVIEVMKKYGLYVKNVKNVPYSSKRNIEILLEREHAQH